MKDGIYILLSSIYSRTMDDLARNMHRRRKTAGVAAKMFAHLVITESESTRKREKERETTIASRGLRVRKSLLFDARLSSRIGRARAAGPRHPVKVAGIRNAFIARLKSRLISTLHRDAASSKNIFPRWTSSGSAAAMLSRSANGNRPGDEERKGARCGVGKTKQEQD